MTDFDAFFTAAASELSRTFGATGCKLVAPNGTESDITSAMWDLTSLTASWDVLDDNGQRLDAQALVTLPSSVEVDLEEGKIKDADGVEFWFLGITLEGADLITYAVSRVQHSHIKKIVLQRRAKG